VSDVACRPATPEDGPALEALEAVAWGPETSPDPAYAPPVFGARLPFEDVIVAVRGGRVVGYVAIGRRTRFASNRHVGVVRAVVVDPRAQRGGVGSALLAAAEAEGRARGMESLRLTVMSTNTAALALYTHRGWKELGRLPGEFRVGDRAVDDIFLGKDLRP
jgi:ribosomal protein S18 acetylase RimI-like enzyme